MTYIYTKANSFSTKFGSQILKDLNLTNANSFSQKLEFRNFKNRTPYRVRNEKNARDWRNSTPSVYWKKSRLDID
jgi:hypothetical protein